MNEQALDYLDRQLATIKDPGLLVSIIADLKVEMLKLSNDFMKSLPPEEFQRVLDDEQEYNQRTGALIDEQLPKVLQGLLAKHGVV